jgi:F-type H+-transporting ATPase subunit b
MEQFTQALDNIGFDLRLAIAHFINFLIVFIVLTKFVFKPLNQKITERQAKIDAGLRDAEKAKQDRLQAEAEREEALAVARKDADAILQEAKRRDELLLQRTKEQAEDEAKRLQTKAEVEIARKHEQAEKEFRTSASGIVAEAAKRLAETGSIDTQSAEKVLSQ